MSTHSTDGREWAKLSDLKVGDKLTMDDGFDDGDGEGCGISGKTLVVEQGEHGLFVPCGEGHHYLDGQADDGEHLVGMWPAEAA